LVHTGVRFGAEDHDSIPTIEIRKRVKLLDSRTNSRIKLDGKNKNKKFLNNGVYNNQIIKNG
jgi:hypothetical protein